MSEQKLDSYRHIWLYAKGRYDRSEDTTLEDLKKIIAERNGLDPECVEYEYLVKILLDIIFEHHPKHYSGHLLSEVVLEAFGIKRRLFHDEWNDNKTLISLLGNICQFPVKDREGNMLIHLGDADKKILPLNKESLYNQHQ